MPAVGSCSICLHDLQETAENDEDSSDSVSSTPCGHVFHTKCVSQWIEQHKDCPHCRRPVTSDLLVKLYLPQNEYDDFSNKVDLQGQGHLVYEQVNALQGQLEMLERECTEMRDRLGKTEVNLQANKVTENQNDALKEYHELQSENSRMKNQLAELRNNLVSKEADLHGRDQRMSHLQSHLSSLEHQLAQDVTALQAQLDRQAAPSPAHLSVFDSYTEDLPVVPKTRGHRNGNVCQCFSCCFFIVIFLIVILGAFVVVPLKVLFSQG